MDKWINSKWVRENNLNDLNGHIECGESNMFKDDFDMEPYNDNSIGILRHKDRQTWYAIKYMDVSQVNESDI